MLQPLIRSLLDGSNVGSQHMFIGELMKIIPEVNQLHTVLLPLAVTQKQYHSTEREHCILWIGFACILSYP